MTGIDFDAFTADQLRAQGSVKWTAFPDTIGAFVAEMDLGLAPVIQDALHASVDRGLTGYLPAWLSNELSDATAAWYRDSYAWEVAPTFIHPVPDVIAAFEIAINRYSPAGSAVIVPTPAYMPFLTVPLASRREVIQLPSIEVDGSWEIDYAGVARAFEAGAGTFVLCNPHNPLGTVYPRDQLERLSAVVEEHGGRVFSDEIHAPLIYPGSTHIPYASVNEAAAGHTVTAASASKAWNLAGLKCAQVLLSNEADQQLWDGFGAMASHGTANFGVIANVAAYTGGRPWLADVVDYLDGNRALLGELIANHLPSVRYSAPQGTYIGWLDLRGCGIEGNMVEFFRREAGVSLTDGIACGEVGEGFARFVFALPRPLLREAILQMSDALERHAPGSTHP